MNCPYCCKEMEKGTLNHRGCAFFLPAGEKVYLYTKKLLKKAHAIPIPPELYDLSLFPEFPTAYCCRDCHKIIMDYPDNGQE